MRRSLVTIVVILLLPPLLLYSLAGVGFLTTMSPEPRLRAVLIMIWAMGIAALSLSGWRRNVVITAAVAYTLAALVALPYLALMASCAFGPCL